MLQNTAVTLEHRNQEKKCEIEDCESCSNDEIIRFEKLTHAQQAQIRKQTDKSVFCKKHQNKQFKLFKLRQFQCCDPLGVHKVGVRADLREIGGEDFHDYGHILDVAPGQKVCRNCRTSTLPDYLRDYYGNSENCRSNESQNTLNILEDSPMDSPSHSETTSSAGYSGDLKTQNAREVIKEVSKTLGVLNTDMRLTHKRCLNETFDQITESLTKKMRILNPRFEESSTLAEEARRYREIIDQLLEKLSNCENSRERYLLLSVLPKRWSAYQIRKIMGVSQNTAKRAKELVENQGILCLVPSKSEKVLNPEVLKLIEDFYTSDDKSRIQPEKNDYVPVLINRERVRIQERLHSCNLKECYQNFKDEHSEVSVGFSRFAEARPPYVILAGATGTHTVCVCKIHQNFELLIHALDLESINDQLRKWNYKDILARIICSSSTHKCYLRKFPSCPDIHVIVDEITRMLRHESINEITLKQWTNVDRSALETFTQKLPQVMTTVLQSLPNLLKHDFIAKQQFLSVKGEKKSLAPGEGANVNARNLEGEAPLMGAVKYQSHHFTKYLIEKGARMDETRNENLSASRIPYNRRLKLQIKTLSARRAELHPYPGYIIPFSYLCPVLVPESYWIIREMIRLGTTGGHVSLVDRDLIFSEGESTLQFAQFDEEIEEMRDIQFGQNRTLLDISEKPEEFATNFMRDKRIIRNIEVIDVEFEFPNFYKILTTTGLILSIITTAYWTRQARLDLLRNGSCQTGPLQYLNRAEVNVPTDGMFYQFYNDYRRATLSEEPSYSKPVERSTHDNFDTLSRTNTPFKTEVGYDEPRILRIPRSGHDSRHTMPIHGQPSRQMNDHDYDLPRHKQNAQTNFYPHT
ncbi:hypothetical protein QAD02_003410 [Eretmocerus hayati]|uniref:Uncharacterized protein n=1 Tax=Eretmocerus hayati TaxID=131215 RepID=A0ACC2NMM0_9HYME|nr:hypothetical protein QAD02_003410 [Eretmocerus hayati]